jgi:serine/threonine-protein kinase RsbT
MGNPQSIRIRTAEDVLLARQEVMRFAALLAFSPGDRGRLELAVTELATNLVKHAGGGNLVVSKLSDRPGIRIVCVDQGPGIVNIAQAMQAGYSTTASFGDGLASIKEVMDRFELTSVLGQGTRIEAEKWVV